MKGTLVVLFVACAACIQAFQLHTVRYNQMCEAHHARNARLMMKDWTKRTVTSP